MELTNSQLLAILDDISEMTSQQGIPALEAKYSGNHHPEIDYTIGVKALIKGHRDTGIKRLIHCATEGSRPPYKWFSTSHSNAIGQSMAILQTKELLSTTNQEVAGKLFVFSYLYLSSCIDQFGIKAYQSFESRASLFLESDFSTIVYNYCQHIGITGEMISMLAAHDLYKSSLGYFIDPVKGQKLADQATEMMLFCNKHVAEFETVDEFINAAETLHKSVYDKLYGMIRLNATIEGVIE